MYVNIGTYGCRNAIFMTFRMDDISQRDLNLALRSKSSEDKIRHEQGAQNGSFGSRPRFQT